MKLSLWMDQKKRKVNLFFSEKSQLNISVNCEMYNHQKSLMSVGQNLFSLKNSSENRKDFI